MFVVDVEELVVEVASETASAILSSISASDGPQEINKINKTDNCFFHIIIL